MSARPDIPADVMRLAEATFELGASEYRTTPQMIAEAIVAERARFVERVETEARGVKASNMWGDCHLALDLLAGRLRAEGWA